MSQPAQRPIHIGPIRLDTAARMAWWCLLAASIVVALWPRTPEAIDLGWDKANHLVAYAGLTLLGCWTQSWRQRTVALVMIAHGGLVEVLQGFTTYRSAEWADLLADALGIGVGIVLTIVLQRMLRWVTRVDAPR
jgi:VanZ family protein